MVRGTPPLDRNPDGSVLGPDGEGEPSMTVGPLYAMSPMQVETPSSPHELPLIHLEVSNEFCPGEQLDSEPLSRSGSLVDYTFEENELGKMPKGDSSRLSGTTAHEFSMRLAVKGETRVLAPFVNPVNPGRVGWENSLSDDPGKGNSPHSPPPSAGTATVVAGPPPRHGSRGCEFGELARNVGRKTERKSTLRDGREVSAKRAILCIFCYKPRLRGLGARRGEGNAPFRDE